MLVIGATGKVGRHVVAGLLERGALVRALTGDPDAAHLPDGVELAVGDLSQPQTLPASVGGADALFLVWPFLSADRADVVIEVLVRTRRIVYLSAQAASTRPDSFWACGGKTPLLLPVADLAAARSPPASRAERTLTPARDGECRFVAVGQSRSHFRFSAETGTYTGDPSGRLRSPVEWSAG
jgi:NAD(P)-dependent dehydrogenase (short-subunit alcohol dehydrogenase family)